MVEPGQQDLQEFDNFISWPRVKLGDIVHIAYGKGLRIADLTESGYPVFGANGKIGYYSAFTHKQAEVLVTCRGATCGTINRSKPKSFITSNSLVLQPKDESKITKDYLAWALKQNGLALAISGSAQEQITIEKLAPIEILLPPLETQRQIAVKLDLLSTHTKRADNYLSTLPILIDRFRQSVLARAFTGELTADWRKANPGVEPASELLERIKVERRQKWIHNYAKKLADRAQASAEKKGKPFGDEKWQSYYDKKIEAGVKKYEEPEPVDAEKEGLPEIPEGWEWVRLEQLFDWSNGSALPGSMRSSTGEFPVYGGNGVAGKYASTNVDHRTLIIGRVGAHCGNVHLSDTPAWVTDNAIFSTILPESLSLSLFRIMIEFRDLNRLAGGSGQPYVNQSLLNDVGLPLPPLPEQIEIVRRTSDLLDLLSTFAARANDATQLLDRLKSSTLSAVLSG